MINDKPESIWTVVKELQLSNIMARDKNTKVIPYVLKYLLYFRTYIIVQRLYNYKVFLKFIEKIHESMLYCNAYNEKKIKI